MRKSLEHRDIEFRGTPGGALDRVVRLPDGREYAHRCSKETFEAIAGHLADHPQEAVKLQSLADTVEASMNQVNVAIQLIAQRGLLETRGRETYVVPAYASGFFEHAMTEFYALIEGRPPEAPEVRHD